MKKTISVDLSFKYAGKLREKANEYRDYFIKETKSILGKKDKSAKSAWLKTCASMDRIDDTVWYLNSLKLMEKPDKYEIFDYYNFINHASVLIGCIDYLAEIFGVGLESVNLRNDILHYYTIDENWDVVENTKKSDKDYFEYIRSLSSVHPIETNRHKDCKDSNTDIECSPFMMFCESANKNFWTKLIVYTDGKDMDKSILIDWKQIFEYVRFRYSLIDDIVRKMEEYFTGIEDGYREKQIMNIQDFGRNYPEYIIYLSQEMAKRVCSGYEECFTLMSKMMDYAPLNDMNLKSVERFKSAIMESLRELYDYLQELPKDKFFTDTKFYKIQSRPNFDLNDPNDKNGCGKGYCFEKLSSLWSIYRNHPAYRNLVNYYGGVLNKYVVVDEKMSDDEISFLVYSATYCWAVDNNKYS